MAAIILIDTNNKRLVLGLKIVYLCPKARFAKPDSRLVHACSGRGEIKSPGTRREPAGARCRLGGPSAPDRTGPRNRSLRGSNTDLLQGRLSPFSEYHITRGYYFITRHVHTRTCLQQIRCSFYLDHKLQWIKHITAHRCIAFKL